LCGIAQKCVTSHERKRKILRSGVADKRLGDAVMVYRMAATGQTVQYAKRLSMARSMVLLFASTLLLLSIGCTYSTNPIHTKDDLRFDDKLLGSWKTKDIPGIGRLDVSRPSPTSDSYRVRFFDQNESQETGLAEGFLCQLEQKRFITLKFESKPEEKLPLKIAYLTFVIDQQEDNLLKVRYLNQDRIAKHLKSQPDALKHELNTQKQPPSKPDVVITAETAEFRTFVQSVLEKADFWVPMELKKAK
jgi:hypothetical protein